MRTLVFASKEFDSEFAVFCREAAAPPSVSKSVSTILAAVRREGDAAVARYASRFDGARLRPAQFRVGRDEIRRAVRGLAPARRTALRSALASIRDFNRRTLPKAWRARNPHGAMVGEKFDPIRRVGVYVPGGEAPLVSTAFMTAALAAIAGCPQIAACTPVGPGLTVAPELLAALDLAGVSEVYRIGGVQAIGAMAYGTRIIPPVDKIFGPGNAYVCEAKRQVFGSVGVDLLPGPSELMVVADGTARPDYAAADLLAQAEHGSGRERLFLVGTSHRAIVGIVSEIERQLGSLSRAAKIRKVLDHGFASVQVATLSQAAEVANRVAPEHLQLLVSPKAAAGLVAAVTTAGAIFIGNDTPTVLGDFVAGPSHVLPTAGAGRFSSGLQVADFLRRTSLVAYDAQSLRRALPVVRAFSEMERLDAHGASAVLRLAGARNR